MWAMTTTISAKATMLCQDVAYCISCVGVSCVGRLKPSMFTSANVLANSAVWNGNIKASPDSDSDSPPNITAQNTIFCPALNFQAGGCEPFTNMPPPLASQTKSRQCGNL